MRSLTNLPETSNFPKGEADQARFDEGEKNSDHSASAGSVLRGFNIFALVAVTLFSAGLVYGDWFGRLGSSLSVPLEHYFRNAGIVLNKIHIKGQVNLGDEQVIAALGIRSGQSLAGFDANKAQRQLVNLGQIKSARVMRLLPSTLLVEISERLPFARWMHDGRVDLIDRDGVVLVGLAGKRQERFPLVAGAGAAGKAEQLIRILSTHEQLAGQIEAAERVAHYRWNLHARSGAMIKLPPANLALGLARFVALPGWGKLLSRKNLVVDLRHPGQAFVRERDGPTALFLAKS